MAGKSQLSARMPRPNTPVSLADLAAAGVRLRPYESVTIVRELVLQVARGEVAGVPSLHVIRLSASGIVSVEGPVAAGGRPVMRAAQLLESLLPASEAGNQFRVPGGLKLVVARALGTLDLPPFPSLDAFADALARFAATDPRAMVSNVVIVWSDLVASRSSGTMTQTTEPASATSAALVEPFMPPPVHEGRGASATSTLTVSDIRRARRATGMPLAQVADRSRIPLGLLRQLEWGYLFNWPGGFYGRTQLIRYARAAGLDDQLVVGAIEPLIHEAESRRALVVRPSPLPVVPPAPRYGLNRLSRSRTFPWSSRPARSHGAGPTISRWRRPVRGRKCWLPWQFRRCWQSDCCPHGGHTRGRRRLQAPKQRSRPRPRLSPARRPMPMVWRATRRPRRASCRLVLVNAPRRRREAERPHQRRSAARPGRLRTTKRRVG